MRPAGARRVRRGERRRGISLIEMMIALSVLVVILSSVSLLMRNQAHALEAHAGRLDAGYNARFAVNTIYRELRSAGSGVVSEQPMLVQADSFAITFNADLVTSSSSDPTAEFVDAKADSAATVALTKERAVTLPRGAATYPDSTYYLAPGIVSRAETISFWVAPDSSTTRADDYIVFKRVNDGPAKVVARGIILSSGEPLFRYFVRDSVGSLVDITDSLPLRHVAPLHGSLLDVGRGSRVDDVRLVKIHVEAVYEDRDKGDVIRSYERLVPIVNSGLVRSTPCGASPAASGTIAATRVGGDVKLVWSPSADDGGGEKDVERYGLFRRRIGSSVWGEPFTSIPAAQLSSYSYTDGSVPSGQWIYAVVAQDCTPSMSTVALSNSVTIP